MHIKDFMKRDVGIVESCIYNNSYALYLNSFLNSKLCSMNAHALYCGFLVETSMMTLI